MKTLCKCGHAKKQHPNKECDYKGYTCSCTVYRRAVPAKAKPEQAELLDDAVYIKLDRILGKMVIVGASKTTYPIVKVKP